jgi:hypothetical protein
MSPPPWGHVAEWLRNGLQNRVHQFNSGRGLQFHPFDFITLLDPAGLLETVWPRDGEAGRGGLERLRGCPRSLAADCIGS